MENKEEGERQAKPFSGSQSIDSVPNISVCVCVHKSMLKPSKKQDIIGSIGAGVTDESTRANGRAWRKSGNVTQTAHSDRQARMGRPTLAKSKSIYI